MAAKIFISWSNARDTIFDDITCCDWCIIKVVSLVVPCESDITPLITGNIKSCEKCLCS
jgi:hypothetical protein